MNKLILGILLISILNAYSQKGITFEIEKLEKPSSNLPEITFDSIAKSIDANVISICKTENKLVFCGKNAFLAGLERAYAEHRPFVISPDMIWLLINQGFANHVNNNAEQLRNLFVDFKGKKILVVVDANTKLKDSDPELWIKNIPQFITQLKQNTKDSVIDILGADFSTTTLNCKIANQVTIMETMKPYFYYLFVSITCGIPQITLEGTTEDWEKIYNKTVLLKKYDLDWWVDGLLPVLKEFINTSKGQIDTTFWRNIYKVHTEKSYGAPRVIDGWILKFFPYNKKNEKMSFDKINSIEELPDEIVHVPFLQLNIYSPQKIDTFQREFCAGFIGLKQNRKSKSLRPEIGWYINDKGKIDKNVLSELRKSANANSDLEYFDVEAIPIELLQLKELHSLTIHFSHDILIPKELSNVKINILKLFGHISKDEVEKLTENFPYSEIHINEESIQRAKALINLDTISYFNTVFNMAIVEQKPEFPGGLNKLNEYIRNNIKYPEFELSHNIIGEVYVQFLILKDGTIKDVSIVRSVSIGLDTEAIRIVKYMPTWIPGKQNGQAVNVKYILPVKFILPKK